MSRKSSSKSNKIEGMSVVMVNTTYTQAWLDNAIARRKPGDPMSIVLPRSMIDDQDFFEQLLNESYDRDKGTWLRIDNTTIPVDFRDCVRYARAAAEEYCNGNWTRIPATRPVIVQTAAQRHTVQQQQAATTTRQANGGFVRKTTGRFVRRRS